MAATQTREDLDGIAEAFVRARADRRVLPTYPGTIPADLSVAYAIQDAAIARNDDVIVGWKVGRIPDPDVAHFGANRLAGPIFARTLRLADGDTPAMPIFVDGFAAAEAEFVCRVGSAPPAGKTSFTAAEAADLVESLHVGIEIASSPFPGINDHGAAVTASDFGNNYGLVIGEAIANWRTSGFESWPVLASVDDVEVGRATTETMLDGAIGAVRFLLELLAERGIAMPAGTWITTGAVTGVHMVVPGQRVKAQFGQSYAIGCRIAA